MPTPRLTISVVVSRKRLADELLLKKREHWGEKDDCVFDVLTTGDLRNGRGGCLLTSLLLYMLHFIYI
jgi:hypothetical protein